MKHLPPYQPRVMGIETEYGIYLDQDPNPLDEGFITTHLRNGLLMSVPPFSEIIMQDGYSGFASFGGRLYIDHGGNIEHATPECISQRGLLAAHFAGERIVETAVKILYPKAEIYKRTADAELNTRGAHENYLTGSNDSPDALEEFLLPHLVTRTIIVGPGMIMPEPRHQGYVLDQKVWSLGDKTMSGSTIKEGEKPFIIIRNEHFAKDGMHRLQIAAGSHNMFAFPEAAKSLGTSLVIRLCEQGLYPGGLFLDEHPAQAARQIASDISLKSKVRLAGGREYTAAQVQLTLAESFVKLADKDKLPEDEKEMAYLLLDISSDLAEHRLDRWVKHLEWLAKLRWLEACMI